MCSLHHTHLMSADVESAVRFSTEHFGGEVVADLEFAGARNVFVRVGRAVPATGRPAAGAR